MKILYTLPLLLLVACDTLKTPADRYYALTTSATIATNVAQNYADDCHAKPVTDDCYRQLPRINAAARAVLKAKKQGDKVFVTHDSLYYDLSLSTLENAITDLTALIKG